jgi:hypothetical protein
LKGDAAKKGLDFECWTKRPACAVEKGKKEGFRKGKKPQYKIIQILKRQTD